MRKSKVKVNATFLSDLKEYNRIMRKYGSVEMSEKEYLRYRQGRMKVKTKAVFGPMHATTLVRQTTQKPSEETFSKDNGTYKQPKEYTGDRLLGIGMLHKSNLVPIFSKDEAIEISTMRRS